MLKMLGMTAVGMGLCFSAFSAATQPQKGKMMQVTAATQHLHPESEPEFRQIPNVTLMDKPYVPLMTVVGGDCMGNFTEEQIKQIATTWRMVNSHGLMVNGDKQEQGMMKLWAGPDCGKDAEGRTSIDRIKAINPDFIFSNYRNGSYISQNCPDEAREVETRFPLAISVWNTSTTLTKSVSASDSTLIISKFPTIPADRPAFYPFKKSTTTEEHSKNPREYVAFIRLGDEAIRIDDIQATADGLTMQVKRGIWGTTASDHSEGTPVLQPIYIGRNMGIDKGDAYLSGTPDNKSPQLGLRYALITKDPKFQEWLGEKAAAIFNQNYDVCWLDVSVSTWYNNANPYGDDVNPWNLATNANLTNDEYREWQQIKTDALYQRFPDKKFWINNVKPGNYWRNGHDRYQLSGENGHHPVDGGCMENYAQGHNDWPTLVDQTIDMAKNFQGVAWSKGQDVNGYRLFSYATYLLAYEPKGRLYFAISEGTGLLKKPQSMFYCDLGEPQQHFDKAADAAMSGHAGIYARKFAKGLVLVNAAAQASSIDLDSELIDIDNGQSVKSVSIGAYNAKILLMPQK